MLYGSKLREIHVIQLMLAELLGPKTPATVTILSGNYILAVFRAYL